MLLKKFFTRTVRCMSTATTTTADPLRNSQISLSRTGGNQATHLVEPHLWFPKARQHRRKIVCHLGPTNSGKTHRAIERLKTSHSGVYCGPLRLLAWEIFERLNAEQIPCDLMTGQEAEQVEGAKVVSCTTEMVDVNQIYDVAVIDEVQLIADKDRGWAWTRALLGIPAREVHLCGEPAALPLIERLCAATGDELVVHNYDRLSPLNVNGQAIESLREVRKGDAVIAFSRRELFWLKRQIESNTGENCCIVYGALPPEVRRQQARLFNDTNNPSWSIIVATDAIGMGLNLNIGRVVFSTVRKYDGVSERPLAPNEVKQIGGRAGRFGSQFPVGSVTCLQDKNASKDWLCQSCSAVVFSSRKECFRCKAPRSYQNDSVAEQRPQGEGDDIGMDFIRKMMEVENTPLLTAGLAPTEEHLELFARESSVLHLLVPVEFTEGVAMVTKDVADGVFDGRYGSVVTVSKRTTESLFESRQDYEKARTKKQKKQKSMKNLKKQLSDTKSGVYRTISVSGSTKQLRQTIEFMLGHFDPDEVWNVAIPTSKLKLPGMDETDVETRLKSLTTATPGCEIKMASPSITSGIPGTTVLKLEGTQAFGVLEGIGSMCEGEHSLFAGSSDNSESEAVWSESMSKWGDMLHDNDNASEGILQQKNDVLDIPFSHMLMSFHRAVTLDSDMYHMIDVEDMITIAATIDHLVLDLETRFTLCRAPLNIRNAAVLDAFIEYSRKLSEGLQVDFELELTKNIPSTAKEMENMERSFKVIECYLWMARRFPEHFPEEIKVNKISIMYQEMMEDGLNKLSEEDAAKFAGKGKKNKRQRGQGHGRPAQKQGQKQGKKQSHRLS